MTLQWSLLAEVNPGDLRNNSTGPSTSLKGTTVTIAKVDSGSGLGASFGAPASISSLLPPSLQPYIDNTLAKVSTLVAEPANYVSTQTGLSPSAVLATAACLILAIPFAMWSSWSSWSRPTLSPYASMNQGRTPHVTDEDYSYITSQELEEPQNPIEDDILNIKYRGITYEAHFPAYAIGDGKLQVHDIRDRGRQLREPGALARDYGVKNMSEILAMIRDDNPRDTYAGGYGSEEEVVPKKKSKASSSKDGDSIDSGSPSVDLAYREDALTKLDNVAAYFDKELAPECIKFTRSPPADRTKRDDEHRRLSETILAQVILKLDGVEPNGDEVIRARRKELVRESQQVLGQLDAAKASK
ncbi:unnamed protein product [Parascedosporium putredinis]|uniref:BAG domain-containing protein n=1 Tax=Parascedosporium putredinis TaxID=1442378 RepID=A0A9P1GY03_9PEZI|nr:unnamed protein product [Parascedosporium putredinis]CAI7991175.1 unnamed protein product [Parascedosporium putredinis]